MGGLFFLRQPFQSTIRGQKHARETRGNSRKQRVLLLVLRALIKSSVRVVGDEKISRRYALMNADG